MVQELLSVMGKPGVLANLVLFEQLMPNYLKELNDDFARWQQDNSSENRKKVADQAHKIKGGVCLCGTKSLTRNCPVSTNMMMESTGRIR